MEKLLQELALISLEGVVGPTTPVLPTDTVVGVLDETQRKMTVLIDKIRLDLNTAATESQAKLEAAKSPGDKLRVHADHLDATEGPAKRYELLQEIMQNSVMYANPGHAGLEIREGWQLVAISKEELVRLQHSSWVAGLMQDVEDRVRRD